MKLIYDTSGATGPIYVERDVGPFVQIRNAPDYVHTDIVSFRGTTIRLTPYEVNLLREQLNKLAAP